MTTGRQAVHPAMTVLDVVSAFKGTESVFKRYDALAGECICCNALFESLESVAGRYHLDLELLMADLESAVTRG